MCSFIGLGSLSSEADFESEIAAFKETLDKIKELSENTANQVASLSDELAILKDTMVQIEDARSV